MPKRGRPHRGGDQQNKRQKVVREAPSSEPITNARHLKRLLTFNTDVSKARHGLQSFKVLLDHMMTDGPHDEEQAILAGYLEAVRPWSGGGSHDDDEGGSEADYLPDIMATWAHAAKMHHNELLSQCAAVLALALHVGSRSLALAGDMRGVGETLLREPQLALVARNLSADAEAGFVISPALRLLREVVALDGGGVLARRVLRAQQWTFASLARNLDVRFRGDGVEEVQRPSVRTNAARFLIGLVRYLPPRQRGELVAVKGLLSAFLSKMLHDPPELIGETLDCMRDSVVAEKEIARPVKGRLFWGKVLTRMVGLYGYSHDRPGATERVADKLHSFLLSICTTPAAGVVVGCKGLYPKSLDITKISASNSKTGRVGSLLNWMEVYERDDVELSIRNETLFEVAEHLKPWANDKHRELLVAIFKAAPELIVPYFRGQKDFDFAPKLTTTWMGYAAFLYATAELPIPGYFGSGLVQFERMPPPTALLLDSIIPRPLEQAVLLRCFEPKWPLVSLFAARLLIKSFQKLGTALQMHRSAAAAFNEPGKKAQSSASSPAWHLARHKLLDDFSARVPDLKAIFRWYKSIPADSVLSKVAASQLLLLYYDMLPNVKLRATFDVSPLLARSLLAVEGLPSQATTTAREQTLAVLELENLLEVASMSDGMRWFSKLPGQTLSAYTVLLRLSARNSEGTGSDRVRNILEREMADLIMLKSTGLSPLLLSCKDMPSTDPSAPGPTWTFIDTCIVKCAMSSMKILDTAPGYLKSKVESQGTGDGIEISPLSVSMAEQLPFFLESAGESEIRAVCQFLSRYFSHCRDGGEPVKGIRELIGHLNSTSSKMTPGIHLLAPNGTAKLANGDQNGHRQPIQAKPLALDASEKEAEMRSQEALEEMLGDASPTALDNSALTRWATKSVDDIIDDDHATQLMRLLLSEHPSIRKEALTNIMKMAARIQESSHGEKVQIWLLLSELAESSRSLVDDGPVPSPLVAFATHALPVVANPLHAAYAAVNRFLMRSPSWSPRRLPLVSDVIERRDDRDTDATSHSTHGAGGVDSTYYGERAWLFPYLLAGLRTPADVDVFRKRGCFEDLADDMAMPHMKPGLRARCFKILYRATCIEGGSTTLVTRTGICDALVAMCHDPFFEKEEKMVARALARRIRDTWDRERVGAWGGTDLEVMVEGMEGDMRRISTAV